ILATAQVVGQLSHPAQIWRQMGRADIWCLALDLALWEIVALFSLALHLPQLVEVAIYTCSLEVEIPE
ncbi:MAG: hypothetical protein MKZ95_13105, partial [Pirellulales bacterium]|nr:hypothetical protein [Pirellulales bacterium]